MRAFALCSVDLLQQYIDISVSLYEDIHQDAYNEVAA